MWNRRSGSGGMCIDGGCGVISIGVWIDWRVGRIGRAGRRMSGVINASKPLRMIIIFRACKKCRQESEEI